jgi:hypothetical protein
MRLGLYSYVNILTKEKRNVVVLSLNNRRRRISYEEAAYLVAYVKRNAMDLQQRTFRGEDKESNVDDTASSVALG